MPRHRDPQRRRRARLQVGGLAKTLNEGLHAAARAIDRGEAKRTLAELVRLSAE